MAEGVDLSFKVLIKCREIGKDRNLYVSLVVPTPSHDLSPIWLTWIYIPYTGELKGTKGWRRLSELVSRSVVSLVICFPHSRASAAVSHVLIMSSPAVASKTPSFDEKSAKDVEKADVDVQVLQAGADDMDIGT